MKPETGERELVFKLLQENATLGQIAQYLKRRGLHYSAGSWDELFDRRISGPLEKQELAREDLIELIRLSEEYGGQHVFLYRTEPQRAAQLIDKTRVESALEKMGFSSLMSKPLILDQPSHPTITDVRLDESLVAKAVERRVYQQFVDQRTEGDFLVRRYRELTVRAVNLFKLHDDGLLELRIYSHDNSSDYRNDLTKMWNALSFLFSPNDFDKVPLTKARTNLWKKRHALKSVIRFSDAILRNALGTALSASTGSEQQSLFDDKGASNSLDEFLKHKAYCDAFNVWWLKGGGTPGYTTGKQSKFDVLPSKDIHVLLKGDINEFIITSKCSKQDYEYALNQLRKYNK
jgi:hypothetical protein